ncbi:hypothetical protein QBC37DRAFT_168461 [Rhypophila decipiens]|uniref:Uncharacterized protein n=1 Tax=Rhypophila decipiens TaxID=261697 RepID=A0AAN7BA94_9PEZI|nr:hypothetical protein QBC37DRAFT_168461 [Rhypophila decipiens]
MGSSQSSVSSSALSGAQFVSDGLPAVQSYPRCHIFGDASLYSVGIRTGYYLQYLAAVLSILFLRGQESNAWLLSFTPLVAAHFVILLVNSTGPGLIVLDWEIVFGLVFWSLAFLATAVFYRPALADQLNAGFVSKDSRRLQQELTRESGRLVSDQEAEWDKRYIAVIKVLGTETSPKGNGERQINLQTALEEYIEAFTAARVSPGYAEASGYILDLYEDSEGVREVVAQMLISNSQLGAFRDAHAEALRLVGVPVEHAQTTVHTLARIAMEELFPATPVYAGRRSPIQVVKDFETWAGTFGLLGAGSFSVLYAGYLVFTIWVLFRGVDIGRKSRCDVSIIFLMVPTSVYNTAALTVLRVLACIWLVVGGLPALLIGIALLVLGASSWWTEKPLRLRMDKTKEDTAFKAVPYDAEKGKRTAGAGTGPASSLRLQNPGMFRGSRASDKLFEVPASELPSQQRSMSSFKKETEGGLDDLVIEERPRITTETGPAIRGGAGSAVGSGSAVLWLLVRSRWEWLFALLLIHTIVVVEMTIRINRLDMRQPAFSSFGEFLAFFLGAFLFLRVAARCLSAARAEKRRRNSARWLQVRWRVLMERPSLRAAPLRPGDTSGGSVAGLEAKSPVSPTSPTSGTGTGLSRKESLQRVATWHTTGRQSGSSMGRFKEMIDEG